MEIKDSSIKFMPGKIALTTLAAGGGSTETDWFQLLTYMNAHSLFTYILGQGTVTAEIYTSPEPEKIYQVLQDTLYVNASTGGAAYKTRRDPVDFDAAYWCNIVFTNNHAANSVQIRSWLQQSGRGS